MTLIFGTVVALVVGLALGRHFAAFALAGAAWYLFLSMQTAYLAQPGVIGFDGGSGQIALQGPLYWAVQPIILAGSVALLLLGAWVRARVIALVRSRTRLGSA